MERPFPSFKQSERELSVVSTVQDQGTLMERPFVLMMMLFANMLIHKFRMCPDV